MNKEAIDEKTLYSGGHVVPPIAQPRLWYTYADIYPSLHSAIKQVNVDKH